MYFDLVSKYFTVGLPGGAEFPTRLGAGSAPELREYKSLGEEPKLVCLKGDVERLDAFRSAATLVAPLSSGTGGSTRPNTLFFW